MVEEAVAGIVNDVMDYTLNRNFLYKILQSASVVKINSQYFAIVIPCKLSVSGNNCSHKN